MKKLNDIINALTEEDELNQKLLSNQELFAKLLRDNGVDIKSIVNRKENKAKAKRILAEAMVAGELYEGIELSTRAGAALVQDKGEGFSAAQKQLTRIANAVFVSRKDAAPKDTAPKPFRSEDDRVNAMGNFLLRLSVTEDVSWEDALAELEAGLTEVAGTTITINMD